MRPATLIKCCDDHEMLHPPTVLQSFGATLGLIRGIYKLWQRSAPRRLEIAPALGKTCMQINVGRFLTQHTSSFAAPPVVRCFPITRIGIFSPKPEGTQNATKRGPREKLSVHLPKYVSPILRLLRGRRNARIFCWCLQGSRGWCKTLAFVRWLSW